MGNSSVLCLEGAGLEGAGLRYNSSWNWCSCLPQLSWPMVHFIGMSSGMEFPSLIAELLLYRLLRELPLHQFFPLRDLSHPQGNFSWCSP